MNNRLYLFIFLTLCCCDSFSQSPNWLWAKSAEGRSEWVNNIDTDAKGNSYVNGHYDGDSFTLGNTTLLGKGYLDIFIAKFDPLGNVIWAKNIGGKLYESTTGIAVDDEGNFYITGWYKSDTLFFGSAFLKKFEKNFWTEDIFIAKYDPLGNLIWIKSGGGKGSKRNGGIAVDQSQNIYITGNSDSSIYFDDIKVNIKNTNKRETSDYTIKFDANGKIIWAKTLDKVSSSFNNCIALDKYGNPHISRSFKLPFIFGQDTLNNSGTYILKYDSSGNPINAINAIETWSGPNNNLTIDEKGSIYLTGTFNSETLKFKSKTLKNVGSNDFFVVKFDSIGNELWVKSEAGTGSEGITSLCVDSKGNCFIIGHSSSPLLVLGKNIFVNTEELLSLYIIKYNINGELLWAKYAEMNLNTVHGNDIAADKFGNIIIVGEFSGSAVLLGKDLLKNSNSSGTAFFIAKLDSSGVFEDNSIGRIKFFPNPSFGQFEITSPVTIKEVVITNTLGQFIYESKPNNEEVSISLESKGMFYITIKTAGQTTVRKLLVER